MAVCKQYLCLPGTLGNVWQVCLVVIMREGASLASYQERLRMLLNTAMHAAAPPPAPRHPPEAENHPPMMLSGQVLRV